MASLILQMVLDMSQLQIPENVKAQRHAWSQSTSCFLCMPRLGHATSTLQWKVLLWSCSKHVASAASTTRARSKNICRRLIACVFMQHLHHYGSMQDRLGSNGFPGTSPETAAAGQVQLSPANAQCPAPASLESPFEWPHMLELLAVTPGKVPSYKHSVALEHAICSYFGGIPNIHGVPPLTSCDLAPFVAESGARGFRNLPSINVAIAYASGDAADAQFFWAMCPCASAYTKRGMPT